jgi:hypothetical protein
MNGKRGEMLFWGAAIAIFIFAGGIVIVTGHVHR